MKSKLTAITLITIVLSCAVMNVLKVYYAQTTLLEINASIFKVWLKCHSESPFIIFVYVLPFFISLVVGFQRRDDLTKIDWIKISYLLTVFIYSLVSLLMLLLLQFLPGISNGFNIVDFIVLNLNFIFVSLFITSMAIIINYRIENILFAAILTLLVCFAIDRIALVAYLSNISVIKADNTLIIALLPKEQPVQVNILTIYSAVLSIVGMNYFVVFNGKNRSNV